MNDAEILRLIATLGIDDLSYKALPLLPLLHVAWADGAIQPEERVLVEQAMHRAKLGTEAERLVRNWLTWPPSAEYVERGRTALVALALRRGELQLEDSVLDDVLSMSREVAQAAGGLWGFGAISREEKTALDAIASALKVTDGATWAQRVARELAEDPPRQRVVVKFDTDTLDLGKMPGILVPLPEDGTRIPVDRAVSIGSAADVDLWLDGRHISQRHCEIRAERSLFYVRDLESRSGTFVDGERIVERRLLGGETVRVGGAELRFQLLRRVPRQML